MNKKLFTVIALFLAFLFLSFFVLSLIVYLQNDDVYEHNGFKIVIDAGHGGIDGGALGSVSGVKESDLNLLISKELEKMLFDYRFEVVMTRKDKSGLYGNDTINFKKRDMEKRREIIEREKPDLMCSIHLNKFSSSMRKGAQVFFRDDNDFSKTAAQVIQSELNRSLNEKNYSALSGDYFMLNCTDYPSVIIECGFLSNPQDEANLLEEKYRHRLADTICRGIVAYFGYTPSV